MKLITRDTDYAVRALCYIAHHKGTVVTVNELSRCLKVPRPFLRKILQILNREGILKSYKGIGGGFALCDSRNAVSLLHLIEIFQGPVRLNTHLSGNERCHEVRRCPLKRRLDTIERYIVERFGTITIEALIDEGKRDGQEEDHKNRRKEMHRVRSLYSQLPRRRAQDH